MDRVTIGEKDCCITIVRPRTDLKGLIIEMQAGNCKHKLILTDAETHILKASLITMLKD